MVVHVRFESLNISLLSSTNQQLEIKESLIRVVRVLENPDNYFWCLSLELNAVITYLA